MSIPFTAAVRKTLSPAALKTHLAGPNPTPLVLKGIAASWPAFNDWSGAGLGALRDQIGVDTPVDVELGTRGRGYLDAGWKRVTLTFGLFLDAFVLSSIPSSSPESLPVGYLAQADLLDAHSHPRLVAAAPTLPHYTAGPAGDVYRRTLWIGPGGSFTPFHKDHNIGIYTQVVGSKVFHVAPPGAAALLKPSSGVFRNTSTLPVPVSAFAGESRVTDGLGGQEVEGWRKALGEVAALEGACEARLEAGDSVLIPQGWWHSAEGEEVGVGVNAWFR